MDKEERRKIKAQKENEIKNAGQIFAKNLRAILKENKITQQELAIAMGVNDQTLSNWFDNKKGYQPKWVGYMALMFKFLIETNKIRFFEPVWLYKELVNESRYISLEELYILKYAITGYDAGEYCNELVYLMQNDLFHKIILQLKKLIANEQLFPKTRPCVQEELLEIGKKLYDMLYSIKK